MRFEAVSFTYPGASQPALKDIDLHIHPGESLALVGENGSGKTTLIKLLTRLVSSRPGTHPARWDGPEGLGGKRLRQRIGVIFQDFSRYQFLVGENIGVGDVRHFEDESTLERSRRQGHGR